MVYGDKDIMLFYYNQYIIKMIYDTQEAYNMLDGQYQQKRFTSYDSFNSYIKENIQTIETSEIKKYKIKNYDDYTEYLCIDNYNNYYIFKETSAMEYTVLLDQYTTDDEIFMNQYNKANDSVKAQLNLNLFQQMLNRKDYEEAYSKLNETFKNEYFSTSSEFEKYVEENLYEYGKLDFEEVTSVGNEYKIKISITNMENQEENKIKRFIVNMEDDETYNIAFNV